jgi:N-acetyl-beta-hexosaminidase
VLGGQACCWTEYTCTERDLDWKTWTRAAAMSEVFWTAPKVRDLKEFFPRLRVHVKRLRSQGVNCSPVDPEK